VARAAAEAYRPDIDGLRALAVSLVIAYHVAPQQLPGGFLGVDVFFVISGYLITRLVLSEVAAGSFSLSDFYARRVRRIVPALTLVLVTCCLVGWWTLLPGEFRWFGRSLWWCAPLLANVYFAHATGYFDPDADHNVLLHLWSLGVEEQFYLAWPLLLLLAVRYRVRDAVLLALFVTSLAISIWGARAAPIQHYYLPGPRAWELLAGALLAARTLRAPPPLPERWASAAAVAGLALIVLGAVLLGAQQTFPGIWAGVPVGGAVLLIAAGPAAPINRILLASRGCVFVGRRSYGLYLWHWPVLVYAHIIFGRTLPVAVLAAALLLTCLAAAASYAWVEQPLRRGAGGALAVPALLAGLAMLTLLGGAAADSRLAGRLQGVRFARWDSAVEDWQPGDQQSTDPRTGIQRQRLDGGQRATTLFVGDSHIQQYWPRIRYLLGREPERARSVLLLSYSSCPMLPQVNALRQPRQCDSFFEQAMREAWSAQVDTVVFADFWEVYLLGEYQLPHANGIFRADDPLRLRLTVNSAGTQAAFARFAQALRRLVASGRRVFIVLSNPTSPQFVPTSLVPAYVRVDPFFEGELAADPATRVDAAPYEDFVAPVMQRLREVAVRSGARVLDPRATLCPGMSCPAVGADGMPLYIDSNHLRAAYARSGASFIDQTLFGDIAPLAPGAAPEAQQQRAGSTPPARVADDSAPAPALPATQH
jgi:peptidoglycan/LPS O-acetylase OafA/YrhL